MLKPRTLLRLYPAAWRERYGDEFVALLEKEGTSARVVLDVAVGALDAWMAPRFDASRQAMPAGPIGPRILLRYPPTEYGWTRARAVRMVIALLLGAALWALAGLAMDRWGEGAVLQVTQYSAFWIAWCVMSVPWDFRDYPWRTRVAAVAWLLGLFYGLLMLVLLVAR
jgi:hypothetical protein